MRTQSRKVYIQTFGCQMNKLDSELLAGQLRSEGFTMASDPEQADIVLYNTCSVRENAENRVFSHVGTYRDRAEEDEDFVLGVLGCMAQRLGERIVKRFDHVKLVAGTRQFLEVPRYLRKIEETGNSVVATDAEGAVEFSRSPHSRREAHHAYVSVMRGCDSFCAYCIVPHVRGRETSREPEDVLDEASRLRDDGVRALTLLGQSINRYGQDLSCRGSSLPELLKRLDSVDGIDRLRFVTSHPAHVDEDLLRAVADCDSVCEYLSMPAQSGSDRVLERMNRGYTIDEYRELVVRARELIGDVAISSDFIVGFPGETEADFQETLDLVRDMEFQQSFMFTYSPREGTRAAEWEDDVPEEVKNDRHRRLMEAQEAVDERRRRGLIGETLEVMVHRVDDRNKGQVKGRTRGNDIVVLEGGPDLVGGMCRARITDSTRLTLFGERVS